MSDDSSPALGHVNLAREHAKLDNYDASLRSYTHAQQEIECEIDLCRDRSDLVKWNSMLKDVKAEEAAIRRIKDTLDEILSSIDEDDTSVFSQPQGDGDEAIEPPQWSRAEQNTDEASTTRKERRPIQQNVQKPRRIAVNRGNTAGGGGRSGIASRGQQQKAIQRNKQCNNNVQKQLQNAKQNQQHQQPEEEGSNQRPALDPSTNPLAQQIIDMGILIREPNVQWDQIAGLAQVKRLLRQNLVILPMRPDICKGLLAPWKSVLFYGPPGTGKSFLAKAVAGEANDSAFLTVSTAELTSKYVGESEKLIKSLFETARANRPSIIFIDEIDSLVSERGDNESESGRRIKTEFLIQMDGVGVDNRGVLVIGATNLPWALDSAMRRRFEKRIYVPLPGRLARYQLIKNKLKGAYHKLEENDIRYLAENTHGWSGADIGILIRDALMQPIREVQTSHFFKRGTAVDKNGRENNNLWIPCSKSDRGAKNIKWSELNPDEIGKLPATYSHFIQSLKKGKPSVSQSDIIKYKNWTREYGEEGT